MDHPFAGNCGSSGERNNEGAIRIEESTPWVCKWVNHTLLYPCMVIQSDCDNFLFDEIAQQPNFFFFFLSVALKVQEIDPQVYRVQSTL